MEVEISKQQLRREISKGIRSLSESAKMFASESILHGLFLCDVFRSASTVLLYHSLPDEPFTHKFIAELVLCKTVLLPVIRGNDINLMPYINDDSLSEGRFHIMEPSSSDSPASLPKVDVAVVPGRAFDTSGNRLGRGGGYYDRLLQQPFMANTYKVGVCFDFQIKQQLPVSPLDVPMHEVISEKRSIKIAHQRTLS